MEPWKPDAGSATTFQGTLLDDRRTAATKAGPSSYKAGDRLGRFVLESELGRGAMGQVFAARDEDSGERVALKTLGRTNPRERSRFKREFRALADVEHPNLVRFGELVIADEGTSFFTMEVLEGVPFTHWLRAELEPGELPDESRLREAFTQLLDGIEQLHARGFIHRDLKPSNVLVCEGRVVLLDFGVVAELREGRGEGSGAIVGTPLYMAPEQAGAQPVTAAADLYAVGVMLYEVLVGEPPFTGPVLQILLDKQEQAAPDPQLTQPDLSPSLRECCMRLLEREVGERLRADELRARLTWDSKSASRSGVRTRVRTVTSSTFVGRVAELATLEGALDEVMQRHELVRVHLRGPGGMGKSTLLSRFVERAQAHELGVLGAVLRGRCRARESLPYKGIDALVEALARHLRSVPEAERAPLRPRHADALAQVFSSFAGMWGPTETAGLLEPQEARGLGWAALRELLQTLARAATLVLIIDDLQWSDPDSVALLRELTRGPDAPPLLLLIATREAFSSVEAERWLQEFDDEHRVNLGPLSQTDAEGLALALLSAARAEPEAPLSAADPLRQRAAAIALRAGGSPMFIAQLAAHGGSTLGEDTQLDQLVARRLSRLHGPMRAALEIIAVGGGPIPQAHVFELEPGVDVAQIDSLCEEGLLVRSEGVQAQVEVVHDRIREVILDELSSARRVELHWALGQAMLAASGEPQHSTEIGDAVFGIVSHLAAGRAALVELSEQRRAQLAELHRIAGTRSARAGAWARAQRDFAAGLELAEPWLAAAARGEEAHAGSRTCCFELAFGHAEALAMNGAAVEPGGAADQAFTELLDWDLQVAERGQVAARWTALLSWANRLQESLVLGSRELQRLGLRIPGDPSLPRGLAEIGRAWRALGRRELDQLIALEPLQDERVRAQLDVLLEMSFVASYIQPQLMLTLTGTAVRLIGRNGYHPGMMRALVQLALALNALGRSKLAGELCDRALAVGERRGLGPTEMLRARVVAESMIWPASRPMRTLLEPAERRYLDACDLNCTFDASYYSIAAGFYLFEIDRPMLEVDAMFERFAQRNPTEDSKVNELGVLLIRRNIETLREGAPPLREAETREGIAFLRYLGFSLELTDALMFGDYEQATQRMDTMPGDYEQILLGVPQIPRYAMHCVVLEARRSPARGLARVRSLARMRSCQRTVERWAEQGPANFGPMAAIVRGEIARVRGREELARVAYEEAIRTARDAHAANLLALALRRQAALQCARGEQELAEASFAEALTVYERWGALAVAARLRERGLDGLA